MYQACTRQQCKKQIKIFAFMNLIISKREKYRSQVTNLIKLLMCRKVIKRNEGKKIHQRNEKKNT